MAALHGLCARRLPRRTPQGLTRSRRHKIRRLESEPPIVVLIRCINPIKKCPRRGIFLLAALHGLCARRLPRRTPQGLTRSRRHKIRRLESEPPIVVLIRCINPIKKCPRRGIFLLAALHGFEPRLTESESAVLPLDDSAISRIE